MTVSDQGIYYEVILNVNTGLTHYEIGEMLYQKIMSAAPDFEQVMDSYLADLFPDPNVSLMP